MFVHTLDPVLLRFFGFEIRWYGVVYALGFLLAYLVLRRFGNRVEPRFTEESVDAFLVWLLVGVVGGARLFEILFFQPGFYFSAPLEMLKIWKGGLSFHGGLLGAFTALMLFSRKHRMDWLRIADLLTLPASFMLGLGRIANFINGELPGRVTTVWWAVQFPGYAGFRHPSQLYEAGKNFLIFLVLLWKRPLLSVRGYLCAMFLVLYGVFRFFLEFVREPETVFLWFTTGQWFSVMMIALGGALLWRVTHPSRPESLHSPQK